MITHHIRCSSGKAQRELDYQFTPIDELLSDTCDWMRVKGMLG
jgi:nucleoside-diphosphate-sugar epimerase